MIFELPDPLSGCPSVARVADVVLKLADNAHNSAHTALDRAGALVERVIRTRGAVVQAPQRAADLVKGLVCDALDRGNDGVKAIRDQVCCLLDYY